MATVTLTVRHLDQLKSQPRGKESRAGNARRHGWRTLRLVQDASGEGEELDGDATDHGARGSPRLAASPRG
jgi:hypothetical protein